MILNLLQEITEKFEKAGITYMLSGSIALNKYAIPRMTMDIDIVIELEANKLDIFLSIFEDSFYIHEQTVREEVHRLGMFNVIDHKTGFKIDFILRKDTPYRKHEFERRTKTSFGNFDVWIVSIEDLIISKLEWIQLLQSDKQIDDIKKLLKNPIVDKEYILDWCKKLNLNTFNLLKND